MPDIDPQAQSGGLPDGFLDPPKFLLTGLFAFSVAVCSGMNFDEIRSRPPARPYLNRIGVDKETDLNPRCFQFLNTSVQILSSAGGIQPPFGGQLLAFFGN